MSSFKKLKLSDVTTVQNVVNKGWELDFTSYPQNDDYLTIYNGTKVTGDFHEFEDFITERQFDRLIYDTINHKYYQSYDETLNTSSLSNSIFFEDVSEDRPTGSYFDYNDNPNLIKNFPTGSGDGIRVIAINQKIFGSKVQPNYFDILSTAYHIEDDGIGNLYDNLPTTPVHVGNIFYSQGLAIITNQDYQEMFPIPPFCKNDLYSFYDEDVSKPITPLINDTLRTGAYDYNSMIVTGNGVENLIYNGDGTFTFDTNIPGTYIFKYSIANDEAARSNIAEIKIIVIATEWIPDESTASCEQGPITTTTTTAAP